MRQLKNYIFVFVILIVILLPSTTKADQGCSCLGFVPDDASLSRKVEFERKHSKAVFTGEVLEIVKRQSPPFEGYLEVKFKIKESWKKVKGKTVSILTEAPNIATEPPFYKDCGYEFKVGESYLVYVERQSGTNLLVGICSRTRKLSEATDDLKVLGKGK